VPGLEAEEQFERFRAPLCMDPNSATRRDRSPPPQNHVGSSKHAEVVEKRGRIVLGMIEAGGPGILVETDEGRLPLGEDPAVARGRDQLRVAHVAKTLEDRPLAWFGRVRR